MLPIAANVFVALVLVSAEPATGAPIAAPDLVTEAPRAAVPAGSVVSEEPDGAPLYGYDKGAFVRSPVGDFHLKANARVQARYTVDSLADAAGSAVDAGEFTLPRARLKLSGHAFTPQLGFELQLDVAKGYLSLKDAFFEYEMVPGWLSLRAGQQKRPFSLQQMTSSSKLALVDRAITDSYFGAGRDIGLELSGGDDDGGVSYAFGVFNGSGPYKRFFGMFDELPSAPADEDEALPLLRTPMVAGRVALSFRDAKMYDEADRDGGPLRAALGLSGALRTDPYQSEHGRSTLSLDTMVKAYGLAATGAVYASMAGGGIGDAAEAIGGHLQASYLLWDKLLPVAQVAAIIPLNGVDRPLYESRVGVSVLFFGHDAKWTTDVGTVVDGDASPDLQIRTQLQLAL